MPDLHPVAIWYPLIAFCIGCAGTAWLTKDLARIGQADIPNNRSSHQRVTPRGGGLAIMAGFVVFAAFLGMNAGLLAMLGLLIGISWLDDRATVSWQARLLGQCFVLGMSLAVLWVSGVLPALHAPDAAIPLALFLGVIGFVWLWHINLFNFMDGIDGLAAIQAMIICFGAGAYFLDIADTTQALLALTLGAATLGFFVWNYPPARIFLGEVGSIPLGFLTGFFLLLLAASGAWGLAIALPLWFWADATLTLARRLLTGHSIVTPHRAHFYQRAAGTTATGHKRVLHLFLLLQLLNCMFLAACVKIFPDMPVLQPLISACFGILYFFALESLIQKKKT
ncbi:MAG: glycosyl transferase [Pseudomonadota bacterium]